jgi:hypothetical protein
VDCLLELQMLEPYAVPHEKNHCNQEKAGGALGKVDQVIAADAKCERKFYGTYYYEPAQAFENEAAPRLKKRNDGSFKGRTCLLHDFLSFTQSMSMRVK